MTTAEWCRSCRDVAERQASVAPNATTLRDELAELDRLMRAAPWAVRMSYAELAERELADKARTHMERVEATTLEWPMKAVGEKRSLLSLAVQIRAVDALLAAFDSRHSRPPSASAREWRNGPGDAYVIPSRRPRDLGSAHGDNVGYSRRGTLHHRIVPAEVGGMPVRIVLGGMLYPKASPVTLTLGAALFPRGTLQVEDVGDGAFRATRFDGPDVSTAIRSHLSQLTGASVILWPELTIDDDALLLIETSLADRAIADGHVPALVVPGSWHRPMKRGGGIGNVAPVLSGNGEPIAEYAKIAKFRDGEHGWEDVEQGGELLVAACDGFLASIAICKDFCDLSDDAPWGHLDVDLMLVPSMGGATTMTGHIAQAAKNRIHSDQRAFVVQHATPAEADDPAGYVLFGPRDAPGGALATRFDGHWEEREL